MGFKRDARLVVYLNKDTIEDQLFRDRVVVAARTMGVSVSGLLRHAVNYALDDVKEFRKSIR